MWYLEKIPKTLHLYWGGGKLSYLRYLTVATFRYYNPDWEIILHTPLVAQPLMKWTSHEQKYADNYADCFDMISKLKVTIRQVDFEKMGFNNDASEVHKSDFLRWKLLYEEGGLWADMDILFIKSVDYLCFNACSNKSINTVFCISDYGHSIGFLMGAPGANFWGRIHKESAREYIKESYQCMGSLLCNKLFPTIGSSLTNGIVPYNLPMDVVYPYDANHVIELYSRPVPDRFTNNTIGIHWYAGHELSGKYLNATAGGININGHLIMDEYIKKFKESFDFIYKYGQWNEQETVSGTGSTLTATVHLREELPILFKKYEIKSILDIGCGDVNWVKHVWEYLDAYTGMDIVSDIIKINKTLYECDKVSFIQGDIRDARLAESSFDVVLLADVLVHLSFDDINIVFNVLRNGGVKYILATHFTEHIKNNNISTGDWRAINFTKEPFNMATPLESIPYNEPYDIGFGESNDKTLSLWKI